MKKIIFLVAFATFSFGDLVNKALEAYNNGDYKTAVNLYQKACDGGDASGCYNLGVMYHNVRQYYKTVVNLYQKACDGGDASGCHDLGYMYQYGQGARKDLSIAKEFFGKACDLGDQNSCEAYKILNEQGVR